MSYLKNLNKYKQRVVLSLVASLLLPLSIIFNSAAIDNRPAIEEKQQQPKVPEVSVVQASFKKYPVYIQGHSQAVPKYTLDVVAQVSGNLISLTDNFVVGNTLKRNELLAVIDPTDYQQQVAESEYQLAQAKLQVLEEERKVALIKKDRKKHFIKL